MHTLADSMSSFDSDFRASGNSSCKSKSKSKRKRKANHSWIAKIINHHYTSLHCLNLPQVLCLVGEERGVLVSQKMRKTHWGKTPSCCCCSWTSHPSFAQSTPKSVASTPLPSHLPSDSNIWYSPPSADTDEVFFLCLSYQLDDHRKSIALSISESDIIQANVPQSTTTTSTLLDHPSPPSPITFQHYGQTQATNGSHFLPDSNLPFHMAYLEQ